VGKSLIRVVATVVALLTWSLAAHGAGLGKLTVISTLGQPFRAEIDLVSVKKDEVGSLTARMASPDAFKQADLPYSAYVSNLKLSIEKRGNGESYVKVSSSLPLNEPFIDFLVELGWSSGRLVRAYTALVDPPVVTDGEVTKAPEVKPAPASAPVARTEAPAPPPAPVPAPVAEAQAPAAPQDSAPVQPVPVQPAPEQPAPEQPAAAEPAPQQAQAEPVVPQGDTGGVRVPEPGDQDGGVRVTVPEASDQSVPVPPVPGTPAGGEVAVKHGDNLSKIALANKAEGLTLEQMLVLLYRGNPEAFAGKNMNRLKTGKVLRLPDDSTPVDVTAQDARKEVRVQAANWNAYREKLAAVAAEAPAVETGTPQSATGKVTTKVQEKSPAAEAPAEVLKLSKGEPARAGAPGQDKKALQDRIRSLEEELAAKTRAAKDSGERIAALEKTIKDMQALMEIKSKGMAELQKPGANPVAMAPAKPDPAKAVPVVKPEPPKTVAATSAPATESNVATPVVQAPATVSGTATIAPASAEQAPKPRKKFVPPPPPPPPSLVDDLLDNPLIPAAGAGALVVLGGLGYYFMKRRGGGAGTARDDREKKDRKGGKKNSPPQNDDLAEETPAGGALAAAAKGAGEFNEEGDPLAEAEIFLTYGRDNLAEERLKEAIAATPKRYELHAKLLEIFAGRNDIAAFEQTAKELQIGTSGKGELWKTATRLGYQLDPRNPRYAAGRPDEDDGTATVVVGGGALGAAAITSGPRDPAKTNLDFNLGFEDAATGTSTDIDLGRLGSASESAGSLTHDDFDLDSLGETSDLTESLILDPGTQVPGMDNQSTVQSDAFDGTTPLPKEPLAAPASAAALDFDFDVSAITAQSGDGSAEPAPADDGGLNFDISALNLDSPPGQGGGVPDLDLSGISLDLGSAADTAAPSGDKDDKWYDVQTKFDLAKAYQEMGDREGAREILQEVLAEGDAEQKAAAQAVLGSLG
jgi:pilus assembly protein FimV